MHDEVEVTYYIMKREFRFGDFTNYEIVKKLQSADAVPVVRCKDCKHCEYASNRIPTEQAWVCYKWGIDVVQDWFCADGERKDDEL